MATGCGVPQQAVQAAGRARGIGTPRAGLRPLPHGSQGGAGALPALGSSFPELLQVHGRKAGGKGVTGFVVGALDQWGNKSHGRNPGHLSAKC